MNAIALLAAAPASTKRVAGLASPDNVALVSMSDEDGHWTHPWGCGQAIRYVAPDKRR
ncbi:MAG: hypothetical protein K2X59_03335 [Sphingomonas sp.]|nr:hypothetical protein [Sphingomonas sp.]